MTTSSHTKMLKQLKHKPAKLKKFLKHNAPKQRSSGMSTKKCKRCGSSRGYVSKYDINLCRRCFRENAKEIGFKKYS